MELKPGLRLKSTVCDAEIMVIKATDGDSLTCGGVELAAEAPAEKASGDPDHMNACVIGKRYVNEGQTVEVLCVKSGDGSLYYNGDELMTKDTKKLPSSD
jgi:co-chaperonin GroES (HSP10)